MLRCLGGYELSRKVAVDLLAAPASQAFIERLFSVCGMLITVLDRLNIGRIGLGSRQFF